MKLAGLALALAAFSLGTPASATVGTIQPGDAMNGGGCTLSFVFDGVGALDGNVYIATAAHCVGDLGQSVDSWPYDDFGTVAIRGTPSNVSTDWAFIEVKPEFHRHVVAAVKGHAMYPTGVATQTDTLPGDLLQFSGYGMGFAGTTPTQEKRVGVLALHEETRVNFGGLVNGGDSGGPIVHVESGKAIGLQSRITVAPALDDVLEQAAQRGFTVVLRTV